MFAKKTYRKTRWLETLLSMGVPTTDWNEDIADWNEDEEYDYNDRGFADEDDEEDLYLREGPWLAIDPQYVVRIKRNRWTDVKYIRKSYGRDNEPHLECATRAHTRTTIKVFKSMNCIGNKIIFVQTV